MFVVCCWCSTCSLLAAYWSTSTITWWLVLAAINIHWKIDKTAVGLPGSRFNFLFQEKKYSTSSLGRFYNLGRHSLCHCVLVEALDASPQVLLVSPINSLFLTEVKKSNNFNISISVTHLIRTFARHFSSRLAEILGDPCSDSCFCYKYNLDF